MVRHPLGKQHSGAQMIYMEVLDQIMVCWQEYEYEGMDCWGVYGQMLDINGRFITQVYDGIIKRGPHATQLDVSGLKPGIYLIRLHSGNDNKYGKLIKK